MTVDCGRTEPSQQVPGEKLQREGKLYIHGCFVDAEVQTSVLHVLLGIPK